MTDTADFDSKITDLGQRITDLGKVVADLTVKRSTLAPSAVDGDRKARAELEKLEVARTDAEKETGLIRAAIDQLKRLAEQHKANVAAKEQQKLVDAATKLGAEILAYDDKIDTAMAQVAEWLTQRRATAGELSKLRVADSHLVMRLHQRYGATQAAAYHGLRTFIGIEHVEPHHHRALVDSDAWLRDLGAHLQQRNSYNGKTETQREGTSHGT
jgi:DNA repair exonuclease SbcCD ATPase subunit